MMQERITIISGKAPVLFLAPHGRDDDNTGRIAEEAAKSANAYAVINNGWKRAEKYDYAAEEANCNHVPHCLEDVVFDEFYSPIMRFKTRIRQTHHSCYVFNLHGMSNEARKRQPNVDMVVGYGKGEPPSYTCDQWMSDCFCYMMEDFGANVYVAPRGSKYAGWSKNNLTQLWRKWDPDPDVYVMQIEVVAKLRTSLAQCDYVAECLAYAAGELHRRTSWARPSHWRPKTF